MAIPQTQNLQTTLDELAGFLVNIKIDMREGAELMPIFEILFPSAWQVLEHANFTCETIPLGTSATCYKFSLRNRELSADSIVEHIKRLITYNEEIEEKQQQLLELQRRREIELQAEIENLRTAFMEGNTVSAKVLIAAESPKPDEVTKFMNNRLQSPKPKKSPLLVDEYVPEREDDEVGDDMEETPE